MSEVEFLAQGILFKSFLRDHFLRAFLIFAEAQTHLVALEQHLYCFSSRTEPEAAAQICFSSKGEVSERIPQCLQASTSINKPHASREPSDVVPRNNEHMRYIPLGLRTRFQAISALSSHLSFTRKAIFDLNTFLKSRNWI